MSSLWIPSSVIHELLQLIPLGKLLHLVEVCSTSTHALHPPAHSLEQVVMQEVLGDGLNVIGEV